MGDILISADASKKNNRDVPSYIVYEHIDEELIENRVTDENALLSIPIEKDTELIELKKEAGTFYASKGNVNIIKQNEKKSFIIDVGDKVNLFEIKLNWGNKANSLCLTSMVPGSNAGTKYYDKSDKNTDGIIVLKIKPKNGTYVSKGKWKFVVDGHKVNGTEDYTFDAIKYVKK